MQYYHTKVGVQIVAVFKFRFNQFYEVLLRNVIDGIFILWYNATQSIRISKGRTLRQNVSVLQPHYLTALTPFPRFYHANAICCTHLSYRNIFNFSYH